jgi:DNA-binding PadR family transcriptional regulator
MPSGILGDLELAVLISVVRLGDDAHGAAVRRDVSLRARRGWSVGAVYAALQRLEDRALLESWMGETTPGRGGHARRCYRATAVGQRTLRHACEVTEAMWRGVRPGLSPA